MTRRTEPPLYQQVKNLIAQRIVSGDLPKDHRVPSENELVRELGVSRMTANRALRELTAEGRLRRVQGLGTFVADTRPQSELLEIRNIADEIRARGHDFACRTHLLEAEEADEMVAAAFDKPPGTRVFHSVVVHSEGGLPVQLEDRYVNPAVAPDYLSLDFAEVTPNEYLMKAAPLADFEHTVEAVLPDARAQALLYIDADEPCLLLHRRTWSGSTLR